MLFHKLKSTLSYNSVMRVYSPRIIKRYVKKTSRKLISAFLIFLLLFQIIAGILLPFNLKLNPTGISLQKSLAAGEPWYNASWLYRKQITIDHTKVADVATPSTTYANFPVLISLDALSNINANGTDIRFTSSDGTTELPREIESYSSGSLKAWVKITLTKDASDSTDDIIYMYYGNSGATEPAANSTYGSQNVWKTDSVPDTSAVMVQHMKDTTTSTITDSTSNANNGTKVAANEPIQADAQIAKGQTFDGVDDYTVAWNAASLKPTTAITVEAWIKPIAWNTGSLNVVVSYESFARAYTLYKETSEDFKFTINGVGTGVYDVSNMPVNNWYYVVGTYDKQNILLYQYLRTLKNQL